MLAIIVNPNTAMVHTVGSAVYNKAKSRNREMCALPSVQYKLNLDGHLLEGVRGLPSFKL